MSTYQQNAVSKTVWPWTEEPKVEKHDPRPPLIASIASLCVGLFVAFLFRHYGHHTMSYVVVSISSVVFICSVFIPAIYAKIHALFQKLALIIGTTLTYVLLVPFFYIAFPMGRISQLIKGKDPLCRKFEADKPSYWEDRPKVEDLEHYRRQS